MRNFSGSTIPLFTRIDNFENDKAKFGNQDIFFPLVASVFPLLKFTSHNTLFLWKRPSNFGFFSFNKCFIKESIKNA